MDESCNVSGRFPARTGPRNTCDSANKKVINNYLSLTSWAFLSDNYLELGGFCDTPNNEILILTKVGHQCVWFCFHGGPLSLFYTSLSLSLSFSTSVSKLIRCWGDE